MPHRLDFPGLTNIAGPAIADAGPRFTVSILLVAAVNFLGLGIAPPTADWALMISENREGITINPLSVLIPALMTGIIMFPIYIASRSNASAELRHITIIDASGNEDKNTVEASATTTDTTPPTFGGVGSATGVGSSTLLVAWRPASDVGYPSSAITYNVYVSTVQGGESFTKRNQEKGVVVIGPTGGINTTRKALRIRPRVDLIERVKHDPSFLDRSSQRHQLLKGEAGGRGTSASGSSG